MLYDGYRPVGMSQLFGTDIIRCALQILHLQMPKGVLLINFENTEVKGVGTINPVALAVEDLNREKGVNTIALITFQRFILEVEFTLHIILYFLDDGVEP